MKKWFNEKFIPQASKLGNQRHLSTIRDAFAIFTPIIIVGALAVLWRSVIFTTGGGQGTLTGIWTAFNDYKITGEMYTEYLTVFNHWMLYVQVGTISVMSIYIAFGIGYFLAMSRGNNTPVIAGLVSLASFMAVTNMMVTDSWEAGMYWIGARGLISAIVVGLLMTELFCYLSAGDKMAIKMPAGVPPAVSRAFAKLFPAILAIVAAASLNLLVWAPFHFTDSTLSEGVGTQYTFAKGALTADQTNALKDLGADATLFTPGVNGAGTLLNDFSVIGPNGDKLGAALKVFTNASKPSSLLVEVAMRGGDITLTNAIYAGVVQPFVSLAGTTSGAFGIALLYVMLISFFWFFGLHGTNIINGAFNPIWLILYANNVAGAENVFVQGTFDAYVFLGGWGATLALMISTLIFGKRDSAEYEISKFAIAPGIFQINEPVTFGYPLVLNAFLVIPLFLVMPVLVFTTYAGISWFHVPVVKTLIPWTMPVGFGGLVASGSVWGFILSIVNLAIATAIWTPFVLLLRGKDTAKAKAAAENSVEGKKVKAKA